MPHDDIRKQNGLSISWGDRKLYESPSSSKKSVEGIYGLPDEGTRPAPGNPNRTLPQVAGLPISPGGRDEGARPEPGNPNLPEERIPSSPKTPPIPEWENVQAASTSPTWERRGIPALPAEADIAATPASSPPPMSENGIPLPSSGGSPKEGAFAKWWKGMTPDQQTALQRSFLAAGLSLMASSKPSRYPVSTVSQIGEAGLMGMNVYGKTMADAGEAHRENARLGLDERRVAAEEARLRMQLDEATRKADFESPGTPDATRINSYLPPTGGERSNLDLGANLRTGSYAANAPRGMQFSTNLKEPSLRGERGLPGLNTETVKTPGKAPGLGYRMKEADLRQKEALTDKLVSESSGRIAELTIEGKRLDLEKTKAEIEKLKADAARLPKTQRDFMEEKARDGFTKAYLQYKKEHPDDEDGAIAAGSSVYNSLYRMGLGEQFVPGAKAENKFDFGTGLRDVPATPGTWTPPGAKDTGRTSGGKKVYQLPDGNYWVP